MIVDLEHFDVLNFVDGKKETNMENMNSCTNMFFVNMGADLGVIIRREDGIYVQKRVMEKNDYLKGIDIPFSPFSSLFWNTSCLEDCFVFCGYEPGCMRDERFFEIHKNEIESEKARDWRSMRLATIMDIEDGEDFYRFFPNACTNIERDNMGNTKIETVEEFDKRVLELIYGGDYNMEFGEDGEVMIRTKIYKWSDNSLRSEPESDSKLNKIRERMMLNEILTAHRAHNMGLVQSIIHEGIDFYSVGHNASHMFYIGIKDGSYYKLAVDMDYDVDIPYEKRYRLTKIGEDWGYVGHY